jgi:enoyl-CoA hydratase/carnithine racemase
VRCRRPRRRIFPLTSPVTWASALLPSACVESEGVEGVDVDVDADVRVSSYREPAISRREAGSGVGDGVGIHGCITRALGRVGSPAVCACNAAVWVGGCEGAAAGAVRVMWSAEVMGFVCAGVPLRGLDPAFVMLVGFLTEP